MNILYGNNNKVKVSANRWTQIERNRSTILVDFSKKKTVAFIWLSPIMTINTTG